MNRSKHLMTFAAAAALMMASSNSWAWKPTTHVYLAELALKDALDDGKLSFYRTNFAGGQVLPVKVGDYAVDPTLMEALRRFPQYYRTGVLGPDAQPDILTGQRVIHPDVSPGAGFLAPRGANSWLKHLWRQASVIPGNKGLKARAYVAGYLTHAAGDMFAHTFVNHFTGKEFEIGRNAAEHIFLEGYLARRTPTLTSEMYDARMDAELAEFIYDNLVNASPGSNLQRYLLVDSTDAATSVPWVFSKLRNRLQDDINAYFAQLAEYDKQIAAAGFFDANSLRVQKGAYQTANGLGVAYKQKWVADIDKGLRAWPFTSHEIAKALFFNPGGINLAKASEEAEKYKNVHLLSMMGLPDFVGLASSLIKQIKDLIVPPSLKAALFKFAQEKLLDVLLKNAYGMTSGEMLNEVKDPRLVWPTIMQTPRAGAPVRVSLTSMNRDHLKLADGDFANPAEKFDVNKFAPGHNTMVMSKLILLSSASANQLITDLAKPPPVTGSSPSKFNKSSLFMQAAKVSNSLKYFSREVGGFNLMLGFDRSMDGSIQWKKHPEKMLLYAAGVFDQVFLKQAGD